MAGSSQAMALQPRNSRRVGWFSLPLEIRDKVTVELLAQDEVRMPESKQFRLKNAVVAVPKAARHFITKGLPDAKSRRREDDEEKLQLRKAPRHFLGIYAKSLLMVLTEDKPPLRRASGLQLLVTCKQVYRECLEIFYSRNTFVLPPGPVEFTTKHFLTTFPVQYTQRIRHFVIELGLQDLTPPVFAQCREALKEFMAKETSQTMIRSLPGGTVPLTAPYLGVLWGMFVKARLHRIWVQKYALNHRFGPQPDDQYPLLRTPLLMTLRTMHRTVTVGRSELGSCIMCKMPQEVQDLLNHAKAAIQAEIEEKVNQVGWRATRLWVEKGRWKSHICG